MAVPNNKRLRNQALPRSMHLLVRGSPLISRGRDGRLTTTTKGKPGSTNQQLPTVAGAVAGFEANPRTCRVASLPTLSPAGGNCRGGTDLI